MVLNNLLTQIPGWLKATGDEVDIVMSSRIRLARNIEKYPFPGQMTDTEFQETEQYIKENLREIFPSKYTYLMLNELLERDIQFLLERHLISKELTKGKGSIGVLFGDQEELSIMVNEEDHLRIQLICSGLNVARLWKTMDQLDDQLGDVLEFAFDRRFGYLTSCPTNTGTALRASVMLHLPTLQMTGNIGKICQAASKVNVAVRGFYGEGTASLGDFFQVSNQVTLGKTEQALVKSIESIVPQILKHERNTRKFMLEENNEKLTEHVTKALEKLKDSEQLSSKDAMNELSAIRLGVNIGLIEDLDITQVNKMFILSQPAHLQKLLDRDLSSEERDKERARFFQEFFAKL